LGKLAFPVRTMRPCVLLLPAHGNAPYLLGAKIAHDCGWDMLIPDFYGEVQLQILKSEFPDYLNGIFLSKELGNLLLPALRDASGPVRLDDHTEMFKITSEKIDQSIIELLSKGVKGKALNGTTKILKGFSAALNCGLPVQSHISPTYFVFTGKMSEIYRLSDYKSRNTVWLSDLWTKLEQTFQKIFIPQLNALSYLNYDSGGIQFTPSLGRPYQIDSVHEIEKTILVVPSGTRLNLTDINRLIQSSSIPCITLTNAPSELGIPRFPSSIWGNPNVIGTLARAGWGTIWQCLLNRKPIGTVPVSSTEDPEISHSVKAIQWSGIGVLLGNSMDPLLNHMNNYLRNIDHVLENDLKQFGTTDGIGYISNILKMELDGVLSE
jgi:hypothetical protein